MSETTVEPGSHGCWKRSKGGSNLRARPVLRVSNSPPTRGAWVQAVELPEHRAGLRCLEPPYDSVPNMRALLSGQSCIPGAIEAAPRFLAITEA